MAISNIIRIFTKIKNYISCGGVTVARWAHNPKMEVRFLPAQLKKNNRKIIWRYEKSFVSLTKLRLKPSIIKPIE